MGCRQSVVDVWAFELQQAVDGTDITAIGTAIANAKTLDSADLQRKLHSTCENRPGIFNAYGTCILHRLVKIAVRDSSPAAAQLVVDWVQLGTPLSSCMVGRFTPTDFTQKTFHRPCQCIDTYLSLELTDFTVLAIKMLAAEQAAVSAEVFNTAVQHGYYDFAVLAAQYGARGSIEAQLLLDQRASSAASIHSKASPRINSFQHDAPPPYVVVVQSDCSSHSTSLYVTSSQYDMSS
jgi:hypothetical protein